MRSRMLGREIGPRRDTSSSNWVGGVVKGVKESVGPDARELLTDLHLLRAKRRWFRLTTVLGSVWPKGVTVGGLLCLGMDGCLDISGN